MSNSCWGACSRPPVSVASVGIKSQLVRFAGVAEIFFTGRGFDAENKQRTSRGLRASMVDSYDNSPNLLNRMERAWLISQQPRPVSCSSCGSNGHVECKWCGGTGFFILGDNMLCEVPSRNTTCIICAGKGVTCCSDCKGTGFRAKWLGQPLIH